MALRLPQRPTTSLIAAVVAAGLLAGCGGSDEPSASASSTPKPTPLASLDTSAMQIARVDFCSLIEDRSTRDALGGGIGGQNSWGNGRNADIGNNDRDTVHEFGCSWTGQGRTLSAWVFARPVDEAFANSVIDKTAKREGCRVKDGPEFGNPTQEQICSAADDAVRVRFSGLINDTWLTCQLLGAPGDTATEVEEMLGPWCSGVATATNTAG